MLRSIFAAIRSALGAVWRVFGYVVTAPCAALSRILLGPEPGAPTDITDVAPPQDLMPNKPVENSICLDPATAVMAWCVDSLLRDAPAPVPNARRDGSKTGSRASRARSAMSSFPPKKTRFSPTSRGCFICRMCAACGT
jgi:hypothetical protein